MARPGGERVSELFDRASEAEDLGTVIFRGLGAVLFAIGSVIAAGILTIADVILIPVSALANAGGFIVTAIFGGAGRIINVGAISTALSIGPGGMFNLGFLTFALGIGSVLLGFYVIVAFLSEEPTGNFVPGIPFDIPTPGFTGPEEDDEDS